MYAHAAHFEVHRAHANLCTQISQITCGPVLTVNCEEKAAPGAYACRKLYQYMDVDFTYRFSGGWHFMHIA